METNGEMKEVKEALKGILKPYLTKKQRRKIKRFIKAGDNVHVIVIDSIMTTINASGRPKEQTQGGILTWEFQDREVF